MSAEIVVTPKMCGAGVDAAWDKYEYDVSEEMVENIYRAMLAASDIPARLEDAERYRYMADMSGADFSSLCRAVGSLDAAIDAARKAKEASNG